MELSELEELDAILLYINEHRDWQNDYIVSMLDELKLERSTLLKLLEFLKGKEYIVRDAMPTGWRYELKTGGKIFLKNGGFTRRHSDEQVAAKNNLDAAKYAKLSFYASVFIILMTIGLEAFKGCNNQPNKLNISDNSQKIKNISK